MYAMPCHATPCSMPGYQSLLDCVVGCGVCQAVSAKDFYNGYMRGCSDAEFAFVGPDNEGVAVPC